jgi:hypothetical protein
LPFLQLVSALAPIIYIYIPQSESDKNMMFD